MDKKIRVIARKTKAVQKDLKSLAKEDKKRDPACKAGARMKKKK